MYNTEIQRYNPCSYHDLDLSIISAISPNAHASSQRTAYQCCVRVCSIPHSRISEEGWRWWNGGMVGVHRQTSVAVSGAGGVEVKEEDVRLRVILMQLGNMGMGP